VSRSRIGWLGAVALLAAARSLGGCYGIVDGASPETSSTQQITVDRFPRLSHTQWELTVDDLFGFDAPTGLPASFAADPLGGKAFDNEYAALQVDQSLFADYQQAAETIAEKVTGEPVLLTRLLPASLPSNPGARARAFIDAFGRRAFRRPLLSREIQARQELFAQGAALYPELDPFVAGVRVSIAAFLQSAHFLYRVECAERSRTGEPAPLDDWQIASRLSYAIWNSMPDQELFRAAEVGELMTAQGVHAQVERMLQAPRTRAVIAQFFDQLYQARQYEHLSKSPALYPAFVPTLGAEMRIELEKFTQSIYDESGGIRQLLTSTTSFVTPGLAAIYGLAPAGLPAPDADGFSRVQLDPAQRSGLLTRSGFLASKGTDTQPNTIQRGVFVLRKIICQPLGDPPPSAQGATLGGQPTNRQRIDALTGPGTCGAGCHARYINPAGFAFEHFGALGEYRTSDAGNPIDSASTFPFESGDVAYQDASELSRALAESPQVHTCFTGYLFEYLVGRETVAGDAPLLAQLAQSSLSGAPTRQLLAAVLESDALRQPLVTGEQR
jgi:hypothetical protein